MSEVENRPNIPADISELSQINHMSFVENPAGEVLEIPLYHIFSDEDNVECVDLLFVDDVYAYLVFGYPGSEEDFSVGHYYNLLGETTTYYSYMIQDALVVYDGQNAVLEENTGYTPITDFRKINADDYNFIGLNTDMRFRPVSFTNLIIKDKDTLANPDYVGKYFTARDASTGVDIKIAINSKLMNWKETSNVLKTLNIGDVFSAEVIYIKDNVYALVGLNNELCKNNSISGNEAIDCAQAILDIPSVITEPLTLPTKMNNVNITWKSSDVSSLTNYGMLYPGTKAKEVTLEGTFVTGSVTRKTKYQLTIPQSQDFKTITYLDYRTLNNNGNTDPMNGERVKDYSNMHFYGASVLGTISVTNIYAGDTKNGLGLKIGSNSVTNGSIVYHLDKSISSYYVEVRAYNPEETINISNGSNSYNVGSEYQVLHFSLSNLSRDLTIVSSGRALINYVIAVQ
ncbi:MAG TPA: hypothetical protein DCY93_00875 [Firmicutes bacterium]|nr:hypothetical protein [Bacillota bacterium]